MVRKSFSPALVDALKTGTISVPDCAGLTIEATGGGKKVWRYKRRVAGSGEIVKMTLGTFPAFTIPDAREWANGLNLQIERGENPRAKMHVAKARDELTLDRVHALYMVSNRRPDRRKTLKATTLRDKLYNYTSVIAPVIGTKPIADITEDELWEIIEAKAKNAPTRANRVAGELQTFFKWCCSRDGKQAGISIAVNPALTLERGRYREEARDRYLSDYEIELFLTALSESTTLVGLYPARYGIERVEERCRTYRRAILLLLLTGCRIDEVLEAPASEYRGGIWTIPPARYKNWQEHRTPLGEWGRALIQTNREWVVPSWKVDGPMTCGWYKILERIRNRMRELNANTGNPPIEHFVFHDLRRTMRSNTFRLGIAFETAERMMGHKKQGLEGRYDRSDMMEELTEGFAKWEAKIAGIANAAGVGEALYLPSPNGA